MTTMRKDEMAHAVVWYADTSGRWAPLSHMYASRSGQQCWLVTRDAYNTVEDIIGRYCPQCCTRYTGDDAMTYKNRCISCFQCPHCSSPLSVVGLNESDCAFQCAYCLWRSDVAGPSCVVASDRRDLDILVLTLEREALTVSDDSFAAILEKHNSAPSVDLSRFSRSHMVNRRWGFSDLDKHMAQCEADSRVRQADQAASVKNGVDISAIALEIPKRVTLLSKRTLRSTLDMQQGRMKILVQPKPNPLDGDSSQKNRGAWWVKDSSAIHELPRITVVSYPSLEELLVQDSEPEIVLLIQNPKDVDVVFRVDVHGIAPLQDFHSMEDIPWHKGAITLECSCANKKGPEVILGAYEDEFLREEKESETPTLSTCAEDGTPWKIECYHNVAKLWIPISVLGADEALRKECSVSDGRLNGYSADTRNTITSCILRLTAHVEKRDSVSGATERIENVRASDIVTMPIVIEYPAY